MKKQQIASQKTILEEFIPTIALAMDDKKAEDIILMDLTNVRGASFDYFMICNANATTLVRAIADNVEEKMQTVCQQKPWHSEGFTNSEWILLDYGSVVVHIFKTDVREHYQLEKLWADAEIKQMDKEIEKYYKKENEYTKPTAGRKSTAARAEKPTTTTTTKRTGAATKSTGKTAKPTTTTTNTTRSKK